MQNIETEEQREAVGWALDMAREEVHTYLQYGSPETDYGDEWPEVARQRVKHMRALAELSLYAGETDSWNELADDYETSVREYLESKCLS